MTRIQYLAFVLLPFLSGCPILDVEAEVPDACIKTQREIQGAALDAPVNETLRYDDLEALGFLEEQDLDADVQINLIALRAVKTADLSGLRKVVVAARSGAEDSTLPVIEITRCENESCRPENAEIILTSQTTASVLDYIRSGSIEVLLEIEGELPAADWELEAEVCMGAVVTYEW